MTRYLAAGLLGLVSVSNAGVGTWGGYFQRVYALAPSEGVFAYARISPDGRLLVYASEMSEGPQKPLKRAVRVVDLISHKIRFSEAGLDGYWSNDGRRLIFLSQASGASVSIWHLGSGRTTRDVAPTELGDYYSWGVRGGRDVILTILGNYFYLVGDRGKVPAERVPSCEGIGRGERPLLSKDGRRVSVFVNGSIGVRDLADCDAIVDTGIQGAKADFSWDGRYIAFHAPKGNLKGYDIRVVDIARRTVRTITAALSGSSLFPSWTKDGRLCFRYDGDEYRGFVIADHVLDYPEERLPEPHVSPRDARDAGNVFSINALPKKHAVLLMIWAPWSAHAPQALVDLQRLAKYLKRRGEDAAVVTALDIGTVRTDADRVLQMNRIVLPEIELMPDKFIETAGVNQIPTELLFHDGVMVDRRLGAQTFEELKAWVQSAR